MCVLVAVLGVSVARSIPLIDHEQALCDCVRGDVWHDDETMAVKNVVNACAR